MTPTEEGPGRRVGIKIAGSIAPDEALGQIGGWAKAQPNVRIAILPSGPPDTQPPRPLAARLAAATIGAIRRAEAGIIGEEARLLVPGACSEIPIARTADALAPALDLILDCGSPPVSGQAAAAAALGTLSLGFGAGCHAVGPATGFREVAYGEAYSRFAVYYQASRAEPPRQVLAGDIPTQRSLLRNQRALQDEALRQMLRLARRLLDGEDLPGAVAPALIPTPAPRMREVVGYPAQRGARFAVRAMHKLLSLRQHWRVAFTPEPWTKAQPADAKLIPDVSGAFTADPFPFAHQGRWYIFAEECPYATDAGVISVHEVDPATGRAARLGIALDEPFHLSFPFVFRHGNSIYMCPETSQVRQIRLYKCIRFPLQWQLEAVLVDDIVAVDSMIFETDRWWMLTSRREGMLARAPTLHIYHADSPLGPWRPIAGNPVVTHASIGRNAGLLRAGGQLYRVSQSAEFGRYGSAVALHRIDRLGLDGYAETLVAHPFAAFAPGIAGVHHLAGGDGMIAFDFWRYARR